MSANNPTIAALLLDRYVVEGTLGEGGIGSVVRAFDQRLRRTVAIKSLKRSLSSVAPAELRAIEDRFSREAIAGSRMGSHPNLVAVYDTVAGPDETLYLILEFVAGGTLAEHIRASGALPLADALRLTADIARGLQAAHDVGLVHRDIKPANIFIAADGRAQVGDFGIAQIDDVSGRTQIAVGHPGTPLYMSPEQANTTGYLRPSSDQYSLGLTLFEMLTSRAYKRLEERDAAALLAAQPRPVSALIERLIAENSEDRYPTMASVLQAAQAIASVMDLLPVEETPSYASETPRTTPAPTLLSQPVQSTPHSSPQPAHALPSPRRVGRRAVLLGIGGLVVAGAAGGTYLAVGRDISTNADDRSATATSQEPAAAPLIATTQPASAALTTPPATAPPPTTTPGPTITPIPLPTFSPRAVTADMGDPNQWNTINVELSNRTLTSSGYTVRVLKRPDGNGLLSWGDWVPTTTKLTPQFAAEVEMSVAGDPANSAGGMLFLFNNVSRTEDQQFLLFLLRGDGRFSLQQQFPGGEGHNLARIDWTPSSAIKTGANVVNVPRIVVRSGTLTCGVNGQQIAQMPVPAEVATFNAFALAADVFKESTQPEASAIFRDLRYEPLGG